VGDYAERQLSSEERLSLKQKEDISYQGKNENSMVGCRAN